MTFVTVPITLEFGTVDGGTRDLELFIEMKLTATGHNGIFDPVSGFGEPPCGNEWDIIKIEMKNPFYDPTLKTGTNSKPFLPVSDSFIQYFFIDHSSFEKSFWGKVYELADDQLAEMEPEEL